MRYRFLLFGFMLALPMIMVEAGFAQTAADSVRTKPVKEPDQRTVADSTKTDANVMVLETIEIRGKVQKPGVLLVPRRIEPEIGKMELERSFEKEVKEAGDIPKVDKELRKVERVESIKKAVEKQRK